MLQNLLTSLLLASAVGGTTANHFDNEPKQAIIIEDVIEDESQTGQVKYVITIDETNATVQDSTDVYWNYRTINQHLSNNGAINVISSKYYSVAKDLQTGSLLATIVSVFQFNIYNTFNIQSERLISNLQYEITYDSQVTTTLQYNSTYALYDITGSSEYTGLVGKIIITTNDWNDMLEEANDLISHATKKGTDQASKQYTSTVVQDTVGELVDETITNDYRSQILVLKQIIYNTNGSWDNVEINIPQQQVELNLENNTAVTYEVIDIPNLMYTVLAMPFTFVSQAFNLTVFAGTPYSVKVSNIILLILVTTIILFIVKLILRK